MIYSSCSHNVFWHIVRADVINMVWTQYNSLLVCGFVCARLAGNIIFLAGGIVTQCDYVWWNQLSGDCIFSLFKFESTVKILKEESQKKPQLAVKKYSDLYFCF